MLAHAPAHATRPPDLADLTIEQLANVEITSVSGYAERLSVAAASVYVITNEDIRRSGARTLPEALRLAPNLEVARIAANNYAISARGMNNADNKLLVLIDGRIVYTPLYSGVVWTAQDVMLEDVDRIEVISGPGSTLWGSNAVNGVINVITRPAARTQGALVTGGAGSHDRMVAARRGGSIGEANVRLYAKAIEEDSFKRTDRTRADDGRRRVQAGFRADWRGSLNLQGDVYDTKVEQPLWARATMRGFNLMLDGKHRVGGGELAAYGYWDRTEIVAPASPASGTFSERLDIVDVGVRHASQPLAKHRLTLGASARHAWDRVGNINEIAFLPEKRELHWLSVFAQDQYQASDSVEVTGGVRFEHNSYTGLEVMPSLRVAWTPDAHQLVWGAVSRAVRTPSRLDRDLYSPPQPPYLIAGGRDFRSEIAEVVELGYRAQPVTSLSLSTTLYAHRYRRLRTVEFVDGAFAVRNQMEGHTVGLEAWATWQATPRLRVMAGGFVQDQRLKLRPGSTDPNGVAPAGNDPDAQWMLRGSYTFANDVELDIDLRHVGALPSPAVPSYTAVDLRVGWRVTPNLEVSVVGENLFDAKHVEFGPTPGASVIPRSVFVRVAWTD